MSNTGKPRTGLGLAELYPIIEEKLGQGGEITFKPHGTSMLPLLRQDIDSVTIGAVRCMPKRLDVILYRRAGGQFVLHRIIGEDSNGFILCGDNQFIREYGVTEDMIIGVMTGFCRNGRQVNMNGILYGTYKRCLRMRRCFLYTKDLFRRVRRKAWRILNRTKGR